MPVVTEIDFGLPHPQFAPLDWSPNSSAATVKTFTTMSACESVWITLWTGSGPTHLFSGSYCFGLGARIAHKDRELVSADVECMMAHVPFTALAEAGEIRCRWTVRKVRPKLEFYVFGSRT
jgi:hypothetical protein